jgi:hypothetical protein
VGVVSEVLRRNVVAEGRSSALEVAGEGKATTTAEAEAGAGGGGSVGETTSRSATGMRL